MKKGASSPEQMTNLSKKLRDKLFLELDWYLPEITSKLDSKDGSTKLLLKKTEKTDLLKQLSFATKVELAYVYQVRLVVSLLVTFAKLVN